MPFTAEEVEQIANAVLDYHQQGDVQYQMLEQKPLLRDLLAGMQTFPGGKEYITARVKGADTHPGWQGYSQDDQLQFFRPVGIREYRYRWYEMHIGLEVIGTLLKKNGLSIVDTTFSGDKTVTHTDSERFALVNILQDNIYDMTEAGNRTLNRILWMDGSQDPKVPPGLLSFITPTPTQGVVGGIDRATSVWWRNRALVGANKITANPTNRTITLTLRWEMRQLKRYGEGPTKAYAGTIAMEALEQEVVRGTEISRTETTGRYDLGVGDIYVQGVGRVVYDPTLDAMNMSDFLIMPNLNDIKYRPMEKEHMRKHSPARPYDRMLFYRSMTETAAIECRRMLGHGMYQLAKS